jgi:hypothetical protein
VASQVANPGRAVCREAPVAGGTTHPAAG